jgi:hypothetical protein
MKLDKYLRPENAPITRPNITTSYDFDAKNERGVITSTNLQADTFGSSSIADNSITESKIVTGAVTETKIGSFAVTSSKIGTSAVTTAKINDLAVTDAKVNDVAFSKCTGALSVTAGTLSGVLIGTSQVTGGTLSSAVISGAGGVTAGQHGYDATNKAILIGDGAANQSIYTSAWKAYTPTTIYLTLGDGTLTAAYCVTGKLITTRLYLGFGTSTVIGTATITEFTLPVPIATYPGQRLIANLGNCSMADGVAVIYPGIVALTTEGTNAKFMAQMATATYLSRTNMSSVVPFTWAGGDELHAQFTYEAA